MSRKAGYIGYQKMIGADTSFAEGVPHFNFSEDTQGWDPLYYEGYGTAYLSDKEVVRIDFYLWSGTEPEIYIISKLNEGGYDAGSRVDWYISGGNGHYSMSRAV